MTAGGNRDHYHVFDTHYPPRFITSSLFLNWSSPTPQKNIPITWTLCSNDTFKFTSTYQILTPSPPTFFTASVNFLSILVKWTYHTNLMMSSSEKIIITFPHPLCISFPSLLIRQSPQYEYHISNRKLIWNLFDDVNSLFEKRFPFSFPLCPIKIHILKNRLLFSFPICSFFFPTWLLLHMIFLSFFLFWFLPCKGVGRFLSILVFWLSFLFPYVGDSSSISVIL